MSMFNLRKRIRVRGELSNVDVLGTIPAYYQLSLPSFRGRDLRVRTLMFG